MKFFHFYLNSLRGLQPQVWLLALVMLINRSGAMVVPFLSIYMTKELGFTYTQDGWVIASFGFGSLFGNYIGGRLVDKFGQYYQQIFSLIATGIAFLILSKVTTFYGMMLGVWCMSFMADLFRPANLAALSIYSEKSKLIRAVSLNRLAMNLGFSVGPLVAGWLAVTHGYASIFYVDAGSCFMAAIIFFVFLKRKEIQKKPVINNEQQKAILVKDPWYGAFLLTVFFSAVGFVSLFTSYTVFLKQDLHFSEGLIGKILAINGLIIFLTEMPIVHFLDKKGKTFIPIVVGMGLIGLALLSNGLFAVGLGMVLVYIILITFGEILAFPFQATFALNRAGETEKGTYMGYYGLTWSLALMVGPPLSFWIAEHWSFNLLWAILGAITVLATIAMLMLQKKLTIPSTQK